MFKKRALLAVFLVTALLAETLLLFPRTAAAYISDPLEQGVYTVNSVGWLDSRGLEEFKEPKQVYSNKKWKTYLNGNKRDIVGDTLKFSLMERNSPNAHMWGRNYVTRSQYDDWAKAFGGNPTFVTKEAKKFEQRFYGFAGPQFYRASLRHIAMLSGAEVVGYSNSDLTVNVVTTPNPTATISNVTQRLYPGDTYQVKISGMQFLPSIIQREYKDYQEGEYVLKLGNKSVASGSFKTPFNKTVNLTAEKAGTYWLTLTVTDGVGRSTTKQTKVVVYEKPGAPEPPYEPPPSEPRPDPPDDIIIIIPPIEPPPKDPTADFYLPAEGWQKQEYPLMDMSYSPNGKIVKRTWTYTPNQNYEVKYDDTPRIVSGKEIYDHTIKFNKPGQYTVRLEIEDELGLKDTDTHTITVKNKPPVADFSMPKRVMEGFDVEIENESRDPDGEIVKNEWTWTPSDGIRNVSDDLPVKMTDEGAKVWFSKPGTYKLKLKVTDNDGATDEYEQEIVVEPAVPKAAIEISGYLKQNRKITAKALITTPERFPIDDIEWEIKPNSLFMPLDVVKVKGTGKEELIEFLTKQPGKFTVRLRVHNTAGYWSEWAEEVIDVIPDDPPIADFQVSSTVLRDENTRVASIRIMDNSVSEDGDIISRRIWRYKFDSDNDGRFDDEQWVTLSSGNETEVYLYTSHVGKYLIELEVVEEFGEPTIPEFIGPEDIRRDNTDDKRTEEKIVEVANLPPFASFTAKTKPKVDVAFTIGEVDESKIRDLDGLINQYMRPLLAAKNIDVRIQTVQSKRFTSNDANAEEVFNSWARYGYNSNTWRYNAQTKTIERENNDWWSGFYDPNFNSSKYELNIQMTTLGSDDDDIGITFGMKGFNQPFYAFLLSGSRRGFSFGSEHIREHGHASGLYRYEGGSSANGLIYGLVNVSHKTFQQNVWNNVKLIVDGRNAKIYLDGELVVDFTAPEELSGSYGFFTNSQPEGAFKNLSITSEGYATLDQVLSEPTWRDNTLHFVANISDVRISELDDPQKSSLILSQLLSENAYLTMLGTDANKSQSDTIIARNENKGRFIYNHNMGQALTQLAQYIIEVVEQESKVIEQYILVGEEITYTTYYTDPEQDPKYQERWKYIHDENHFEFPLGKADFHNQWLSGPVNVFYKTGKYQVNFQARDNPVGNDDRFDNYRLWSEDTSDFYILYVHRRPVPQFEAYTQLNGSLYDVTYVDTSYDLDSYSQGDQGIAEKRWEYKRPNETGWHPGRPNRISVTDEYIVRLWVKDFQGQWESTTRLVSVNSKQPPIAAFTLSPNPILTTQNLTTIDQSIAAPGTHIVEWTWKYRPAGQEDWIDLPSGRPSGSGGSGGPPVNFAKTHPPGEYEFQLVVKDNRGLTSKPAYRLLVVEEPNEPPVADFVFQLRYKDDTSDIIEAIFDAKNDPVNRTFDPDDPFQELYFEWDYRRPGQENWIRFAEGKNLWNPRLDLDESGVWEIRLTVTDPKLASSNKIRSILVGANASEGVIKHTPQWEENRVKAGRPENHFFAGEAFVIEVYTTNSAESVHIEVDFGGEVGKVEQTLTPADDNRFWTTHLWQDNFKYIEEGPYTFKFTTTFGERDGVIGLPRKITEYHEVYIYKNVYDYMKYHRAD